MPASNLPPAIPAPDQSQTDQSASAEDTKETQAGLTDQQILDVIQGPVSKINDYWDPYKQKYQRLENLYFGNIRDDSPAKLLRSQYSGGDAFELIETILPSLIASKIGVELVGEEEDDTDGAQLNEQILDWQVETQYLEEKFENWVRQAAKTVGALQVDCETVEVKRWTKKRKYRMTLPIIGKEFGVGPMVPVQQVKKIFRHVLETIPWEDLIVAPGTSADDIPVIGKRVIKKISAMKADGSYKNLDKFADWVATQNSSEISDDYKRERADQLGVGWTAIDDPIVTEAELETWELYATIEDKIYRIDWHNESQTVLGSTCLDNWHQMSPIRLLSLIPVENQSIGLSPLETAEGQVDSMDTWINILLETGLFDVTRAVAFDVKGYGVNWRTNPPKYGPGALFPVKGNPNNLFAVLPSPKIDGSHQWLANFFRTRLQNKTGVTDYIAGNDSQSSNQTLGEIELKTAQSKKRFALNIKHINRQLSKVFFMMGSNNQQYMPDDYPVRILGKAGYQWKRLNTESIQGQFDYRVRGFESLDTEEAQTIAKYRAMLVDAANPMVQPFVNVYELVKGLFTRGYKLDNASKVLITPQERLQQEDQQKQQQAMAAAAENQNPQTAVVRPDDNHAVHLDVHQAFLNSPAFQALPEPLKLMLARHIDAHRKLMAQAGGQPGSAGPAPAGPATPGASAPLQPPMPVGQMMRPSEKASFNKP